MNETVKRFIGYRKFKQTAKIYADLEVSEEIRLGMLPSPGNSETSGHKPTDTGIACLNFDGEIYGS